MTAAAPRRPVYRLTVRPTRSSVPAATRLKRALKMLARYDPTCVSAEEVPAQPPRPRADGAAGVGDR